jgi:SAM-dependent methyltransferase
MIQPQRQLRYLNDVRLFELELLEPLLTPHSAILDFGAGPGHQAAYLHQLGFAVSAVDVATTNYAADIIFPVIFYDGRELPYADQQFDTVISSNVLEHILDVNVALSELRRVLTDGGRMLHVLPTTSWRFWTTVFAFPNALKLVFSYTFWESARHCDLPFLERSILSPWRLARHGETGNAVTELFSYRKRAWTNLFASNGFVVTDVRSCDLCYSGNMFFGSALPFKLRRMLSKIFGSATRLYILESMPNELNRPGIAGGL